ncbi:MAG: type II secretion system protein [Micavibrio aeruginosavorus]|uniref:Type II secretion system protein n=1 Tax=Micavibrio aeruginosavorus TaxID=349221 RepID=A0A7T5UGN2_9BACT|nr:MAG: type II secretion system protein [Micavibrio aeruginosavorus]
MRIDRSSYKKDISSADGFTLIEMCAVILIMGFMMLPLVEAYRVHTMKKQVADTSEKVDMNMSLISTIKIGIGRYPCPADRSLAPDNVDYGKDITAFDYSVVPVIPDCDGSMQGICRTTSSRDTDIDADALPDPILIGGIPVATLRATSSLFSNTEIIDSWGNKLTYAVSERLCAPGRVENTNDYRWGVIEVIDEHGEPTAGIGVSDVSIPLDGTFDPDGHAIVLSHGPSGRGAFSEEGVAMNNCDTTVTDGENCDNDSIFVAALGNYKADTPDFFDDSVYAYLYKPSKLWQVLEEPTGSGMVPTPHIRNLNEKNVGILTDDPKVKLHVAGNINAASIKAPRFCYNDGTKCFDYDWLGNTLAKTTAPKQNYCATAGAVMQGIGSNTIVCNKPIFIPSGTTTKCVDLDASKPYLRGFTSAGDLICTN